METIFLRVALTTLIQSEGQMELQPNLDWEANIGHPNYCLCHCGINVLYARNSHLHLKPTDCITMQSSIFPMSAY